MSVFFLINAVLKNPVLGFKVLVDSFWISNLAWQLVYVAWRQVDVGYASVGVYPFPGGVDDLLVRDHEFYVFTDRVGGLLA